MIKYPRLLKHTNSPKNCLLVLCSKICLVDLPKIFRMNSVQGRFSKPVIEARNPKDRFFYFHGVSSATKVFGMESLPMQQSNRCRFSSMDSRKLLLFSLILRHPPSVKQNTLRSYTYHDFDSTMLVNSTMLSQSFENTDSHATAHKKCFKVISRPIREISAISTDQYIYTIMVWKVSGKNDLTEEFIYRLITKSRITSTLGNYELVWKNWTNLCDRRETGPFHCFLNHVLEYLTHLFKKENLEYQKIGVAGLHFLYIRHMLMTNQLAKIL